MPHAHPSLDSFDPVEQTLLRTGFLDFGDMWNLTTRLARRTWARVLQPALVAKLLLVTAGCLSMFALTLVLFGTFSPALLVEVDDTTYTFAEFEPLAETIDPAGAVLRVDSSRLEALVRQNSTQALVISAVTLAVTLALTWLYHFVHVRTLRILASPAESGILRRAPGSILTTTRFLFVQFVVVAVALLLQTGLATWFAPTQATLYGYLWRMIFYTLAGLYLYTLVFQNTGIIDSLRTAYRQVLPHLWPNLLRWSLYYTVVVSVLFLWVVLIGFTLSLAALGGPVAAGLTLLALLVVSIVSGILLELFTQVFGYISYANLATLSEQDAK